MKYDLIVIGGGPAGILGAYAAASHGLRTVLLEKNDRLGKKLSLTGNGRCNLTNSSDVENYQNNIVTNKHFLYSALYTFDSYRLISLIENQGLKTKVEAGNRIFPASDQSHDVINTLNKLIREHSVKVMTNTEVKKIMAHDGKITGILLKNRQQVKGNKVLLATGGMSYKHTGSTGDGYIMARELGHNIIPPRPALVPLRTKEHRPQQLQGVTLKDVKVKLTLKDREIQQSGDILFTHFGLSGPAILKASSYIKGKDAFPVKIIIDLKPGSTEEQVSRIIQNELNNNPGKNIKNVLSNILTRSIVPLILELAEVPGTRQVDQITSLERKNLAQMIKNLTLTATSTLPLDQAIVTGGGIDTKEIDPSTLESRIIKGLYFAGELIDVDALTGGYNLQIAFSTGYLSGTSAARI